MNATESASHEALQTYLIYGSILMLLALGGFIFWINYRYKQQQKKNHKPHLELVSPPHKSHGHRRHKNIKNKRRP